MNKITLNENKNTEIKVINFISNFTITKVEYLSLETNLNEDLGVDGDDAIDLIKSFAEKFNIVDFSRFDFDKYFHPEAGFNPLGFLFISKKQPLKMKLLVQAAIRKEWLDNMIE